MLLLLLLSSSLLLLFLLLLEFVLGRGESVCRQQLRGFLSFVKQQRQLAWTGSLMKLTIIDCLIGLLCCVLHDGVGCADAGSLQATAERLRVFCAAAAADERVEAVPEATNFSLLYIASLLAELLICLLYG